MIVKPYPHLGEQVYEEKLKNGLTVQVIPKAGFAKTHAFFAVNYGSMDTRFSVDGTEFVTPEGVAHYLEHKMFDMPTGNVMQMFSEYGGSPNAFTSYDMTAYYVSCTDHVKENLRLLLEFVSTPYFTKESVDKERGIIEQEIRMYEDSADSRVYEDLFAAMYAHHPIRNPIAGTVESIQEITEETLYACYRAFYTADNMILCVVGDVDPHMVFDLAAEVVPKGHAAPKRDYGLPEVMSPCRSRTDRSMEISMPMFSLGFKAEPAHCGVEIMRQEIIGELAAEILMGESSALYSRLYEENLIDSGFSAGCEGVRGASMISASGDSRDPDAVLKAIMEEAHRLQTEGLDPDLFLRLKRSALGRRIRNLDSFSGITYRMCACHFESADCLSFPELFREITMEQVAEFLSRTVCSSRCAMSVIFPNS